MAQTASNPKIDELRSKLKADPKSRLFYQLAEELRKAGQPAEAEQVLRSGMAFHPSYLAAWVSLGRVMREQKKDEGAVEALNKALQLDPGNVVAARLLGDSYLALGQKVEAIKKYKLVHALLPTDEALQEKVEELEREISGASVPAPQPESAPPAPQESEAPAEQPAEALSLSASTPAPPAEEAPPSEAPPPRQAQTAADSEPVTSAAEPSAVLEESPFDRTMPPFTETPASESASADQAMEESPFAQEQEPVASSWLEEPGPSTASVASEPEQEPVASSWPEEPEPSTTSVASEPEPEPQPTAASFELAVPAPSIEPASYEQLFAESKAAAGDPEPAMNEAAQPADATKEKIERLNRWLSRVARQGEADRV
jgi:hypothetical protein